MTKKEFMNKIYNATGRNIAMKHKGVDIFGTITDVRVAHGGELKVTVTYTDSNSIMHMGTGYMVHRASDLYDESGMFYDIDVDFDAVSPV